MFSNQVSDSGRDSRGDFEGMPLMDFLRRAISVNQTSLWGVGKSRKHKFPMVGHESILLELWRQ